MERDVGAIRNLLSAVQGLAGDAETLAVAGGSLIEQIRWKDARMHFKNLTESLEWVLKNTEKAIVSEQAEAKRIAEVEAFWRESDARYRAKQSAK